MSTTFKNIVNRFNTTIKAASSINNTDDPVTFNITDATGIPAVPFYFTVEQLTDSSVFERMLATAVDGDEIVATRAQDGSSKQTFAAGDLVQIRVMAAHIDDMTTVINALEDGTALLAGRSGGQTLIGGTASGNDLILQSSSDATKGKIYFGIAQTSYFDETTENLVITGTLNTHTIPGGTGTIALTTDITGTNSGTNTGDQTSIVGISGSIAEFNTALSDGSFATGGGTATGSNTGDQDLSGKANIDQTMYIGSTAVAINRGTAALTLAGLTLTTPDIGTPSAGTLTNCTFPTLNQNTTGTSGGTVANAVTLAMMAHGTDGNLITYDSAGAPAYVVTGDADQVLTSNGAGAAPSFQDAAGGGAEWEYVSDLTWSDESTTQSFSSLAGGTYDYKIEWQLYGTDETSTGDIVYFYLNNDGSSSHHSTYYHTGTGISSGYIQDKAQLGTTQGNFNGTNLIQGQLLIKGNRVNSIYIGFYGLGGGSQKDAGSTVCGMYTAAADLASIYFSMTKNITGKIKLYRKSNVF